LVPASLLGCGDPANGKIQAINLTAIVPSQGGVVQVKGEGGTLQLNAERIYTHSQVDLTQKITYNVTSIGTDINGNVLAAPPQTITISHGWIDHGCNAVHLHISESRNLHRAGLGKLPVPIRSPQLSVE